MVLMMVRAPLLTLDLGAAVGAVAWASYSSTVFVAVTDQGRVHVYDLFVRRCQPLCSQRLLTRRQLAASCLALSHTHPVVLVGGERGYLVALKLSPNLRRPNQVSKGADKLPSLTIEIAKMERIISLSTGVALPSAHQLVDSPEADDDA